MTVLTWIGIVLCLAQAGTFSGLNLAFFNISKLRLEVLSSQGDKKAIRVSEMRKDANLLLASILWGNVAVNVLLTLLSNSILAGVVAFIFSTVVLTLLGEIVPQAYFSRHALSAAYFLSPLIEFYRVLLYPVAKPTALMLNAFLGKESVQYFQEAGLREVIRMHIRHDAGDIDEVEGKGALNFLALDDIHVIHEGENIDPASVIDLPFENDKPVFPEINRNPDDPFLDLLESSGKKWAFAKGESGKPEVAINTDSYLREALFSPRSFSPYRHCHRPIVITNPTYRLGDLLRRFKVHPEHAEDDVIDEDIAILWTEDAKKIITGSDILGRLLRGIADAPTP